MIRLHHCHQSRSMRSLWLLRELGVEFEVCVHNFGKNLRSNEFLALNPAGRVPALEIEGEVIWESGAITQILCERFPLAGLGRLAGDAERSKWLTWLHFSETISQHCAALTQQHIAIYSDEMRSPVVMKLEARRLGKCYQALEQHLSGREHLLDTGFSAADISIGQAVYMARHFAHIGPLPNLNSWYARVTDRPAFRASLPPAGAHLLYSKDFYDEWNG